jgi:hypothetical protein
MKAHWGKYNTKYLFLPWGLDGKRKVYPENISLPVFKVKNIDWTWFKSDAWLGFPHRLNNAENLNL